MITIDEFESLVLQILGDNLENNLSQRDVIRYQGDDIMMLAAGPGSGKTRVLVLRALRHVLVDDILPENIVITTFTRKAAKEVRTRWLEWGISFLEELCSRNSNLRNLIERNIDINRCVIDTLDSIAEQTLTENRLPGQLAPILMEESASKLILKRRSFGDIYRTNKNIIDSLLQRYSFDGSIPHNQADALKIVKVLCDRLVQDCVDLDAYATGSAAQRLIVEILLNYQEYLRQSNLYDYAFLEQIFLERLQNKTLDTWCNGIRVFLIDEYQDTNPLQEAIYFAIISNVSPFVVVVGDDDQAMYRFRGGSVELFTQFRERCQLRTGRRTQRIDMVINYRSSDEIVNFYNSHIRGDRVFASARINPPKPDVISSRGTLNMPILGMFRPDSQGLADSLAAWIHQFITDRRMVFNDTNVSYELRLSDEGDLGDFVFLAHSIQEIKYDYFSGNSHTRFAGYFRNTCENRGLHIFNPRGQALRTILDVQYLLGLLLLCLDPDGTLMDAVHPTNEARFFLTNWTNIARNLISQNPRPSDSGGIFRFIDDWQMVSRGANRDFPPDWPVLELIFKLITWLPGFQNDPEHQVWLEAITRIVSSAGMASPYGMQIYQIDAHRDRSRLSFIRDALLPIAEDEVEVDEDIMPSVPRNYLQLMTIHQAKGLEFPLVIVDVGSHFTRNNHLQRFLRFPNNPSNVATMEDDVESFLNGPLRGSRSPLDRTFDDLVRLYYVAYSRPQSVLLLVGCENCLHYGIDGSITDGAIPNIALGWTRQGSWPWRQPYQGNRPPIRVNPPILLLN